MGGQRPNFKFYYKKGHWHIQSDETLIEKNQGQKPTLTVFFIIKFKIWALPAH